MPTTCQMLQLIQKDEYDAPNMYEKLKKAVVKQDKMLIDKIIADEKRHYAEVSEMKIHNKCR